MLENGNVGLLRCLIAEKWRSLVGIDVGRHMMYHGLALGVLVPLLA